MTATRRGLAAVAACLALLGLADSARAHDLRPGILSLAETERGEYRVRFLAPIDSRGDAVHVTLEFPAACQHSDDRLRCAGPLAGTVAVRGMRGASMRTVVQLERLDGTRAEWITSEDAPTIDLRAPPSHTWLSWLRVGLAHILGGLDHLAFVVGLLLVLGLGRTRVFDRRLLATISAFTVAHSVTLALAVTGVLSLPAAPVEACIAASVVLVAREATHRAPTVTRRWPWVTASVFGLVHGLGFAGALGNLDLPQTSLAANLAWFNIGVELGQLIVVAAVLLAVRIGQRLLARVDVETPRLHGATCYLLGALAAWWLAERTAAIVTG